MPIGIGIALLSAMKLREEIIDRTKWLTGAAILTAATIAVAFSGSTCDAQTFDLLTSRSTDKVAQSLFFAVDSGSVVDSYNLFQFTSPAMRSSDSVFVVGAVKNSVSSVGKTNGSIARDFTLAQNFPNPFNPTTTIRFTLGKRAKVSVVLYDMTGREVSTLVNQEKEAGTYDATWNATSDTGFSVASGTYFYRLVAISEDGFKTVETKKMTLLR